jgi:thymidylate synthase (FAD)
MASLSVKSTRYTLKELKSEPPFGDFASEIEVRRAAKYLVWTGNQKVDNASFYALEELRLLLADGISNDLAKYALPESYKTTLTWTVNARSLQNFLYLRTDKAALWEIRELANTIFNSLPEEHKYLFSAFVKKEA